MPLLVKPKTEGVAFALVSALINASLTGIIPLAGVVSDHFGWFGLNIFFASIAGLSVVVTAFWNYVDTTSSKPQLNLNTYYIQKLRE